MTREESIDRLRKISEKTPIRTNGDDLLAITMAIKALSQEPSDTVSRGVFEQVMWERDIAIEQLHELGYEWGQKIEPCDDAISREAVLDILYREQEWYDIKTQIEELPPVTQKSGKWIYRREDKYSCSKCGTTTRVDESGIEEKPMYKFCPYCGAKMERSDKE